MKAGETTRDGSDVVARPSQVWPQPAVQNAEAFVWQTEEIRCFLSRFLHPSLSPAQLCALKEKVPALKTDEADSERHAFRLIGRLRLSRQVWPNRREFSASEEKDITALSWYIAVINRATVPQAQAKAVIFEWLNGRSVNPMGTAFRRRLLDQAEIAWPWFRRVPEMGQPEPGAGAAEGFSTGDAALEEAIRRVNHSGHDSAWIHITADDQGHASWQRMGARECGPFWWDRLVDAVTRHTLERPSAVSVRLKSWAETLTPFEWENAMRIMLLQIAASDSRPINLAETEHHLERV